MSLDNTISFLTGWSIGYSQSQSYAGEKEVKQGENHYLSIPHAVNQIGQMSGMISQLANFIPHYPTRLTVKVVANIAPLISLPFYIVAGAIKHNDYEKMTSLLNRGSTFICNNFLTKKINQVFPKKISGFLCKRVELKKPLFAKSLSARKIAVVNFLAKHSANFCATVTIISSIALICLGSPYLGGAALAAMSYTIIDQKEFVPRRISLFMETYMPVVASVGMIVGGTWVMSAFGAVSLASYLLPYVQQRMIAKVDAIYCRIFDKQSVRLQEIKRPVKTADLTYEKIETILQTPIYKFKASPNHCAKKIKTFTNLEKDKDFNKLLKQFNQINWEDKYLLLRGKLLADNQFIAHLKKHFPEKAQLKKEKFYKEVAMSEGLIETLASKEKLTKEKYLAEYLKNNFQILIETVQGKIRVKGSQIELNETIEDLAIINAYLNQLKDSIYSEDILLKIAVEAGDYCARGVKRAAIELVDSLIMTQETKESDPTKNYLQFMEAKLQEKRKMILEDVYQQFMDTLNLPKEFSEDVHAFDIYRLYFSYGFYPVTKAEEQSLGLIDLAMWRFYSVIRDHMYKEYLNSLDEIVAEAIKEKGEIHFATYINQMINENKNLTEEEKESLLEDFASFEGDVEKTQKKYRRLMLVSMGVIELNAS